MSRQEPIPLPTDAAGIAPRAAEIGADTPAREPDAHEAVLIRHGLITHVACLPDTLDQDAADMFLRDAARGADNIIRLSARRFGIKLSHGHASSLSPVEHTIARVGAQSEALRATEGPAPVPAQDALPGAPPEPPGTRDPAAQGPPPAPQGDPAATPHPASVEDRILPLIDELITRRIEAIDRANVETRALRAEWQRELADFWQGMEAALRLLTTSASDIARAGEDADASRERSGDATPPALQSSLEDLESAVAIGFEAAGSVRDANQTAIETRLDAIEASVAAALSDRAGAEAGPNPTLEANLLQRADDQGQAVSRVEAALTECLSGLTALRAEVAAVRTAASDEADSGGLARAPASDPLAALSREVADMKAAMTEGLRSLAEDVAQRASASPPASQTEEAQRILDAIGATADRFDQGARSQARMMQALAHDLTGIKSKLASAARSPQEGAADSSTDIETLKEMLTERGGVLSETMQTSCRSMKNFWLASEDALRRIETTLHSFETRANRGGVEAAASLRTVTTDRNAPGQGSASPLPERQGRAESPPRKSIGASPPTP